MIQEEELHYQKSYSETPINIKRIKNYSFPSKVLPIKKKHTKYNNITTTKKYHKNTKKKKKNIYIYIHPTRTNINNNKKKKGPTKASLYIAARKLPSLSETYCP